MYYRNFFFILFIISSVLFLLSSYNPNLIVKLCGSNCSYPLSLEYIKLTSMVASSITLTLFITTDYFTQKQLARIRERQQRDRENIERIHAELEALKG